MVISFAICTHNEGHYLSELSERLNYFINTEREIGSGIDYEVVVLDDYSDDPYTLDRLRIIEETVGFRVYKRKHEGDFSAQKNTLNGYCRGDWIINLDADEWLTVDMMHLIPQTILSNDRIDAYWLPRLNVVEGLTEEHIRNWNWRVSKVDGFDKEVIMWPDPQMRVYRNTTEIYWVNKVHERLTGFKTFTTFPMEAPYAIRHIKNILRQEQQNEFYDKIARGI